MATYNGWTNYETWNVALWLGNDEGLYRAAREMARGGVDATKAEQIVRELMPDGTPDFGPNYGYAAVDWWEIARYLSELEQMAQAVVELVELDDLSEL